MKNEWRELDVNNLPPDFLVEGVWEHSYRYDSFDEVKELSYVSFRGFCARWIEWEQDRTNRLHLYCRRPEGWKPKECPRFGLTSAAVAADAMRKVATLVRLKEEPKKTLTHEETVEQLARAGERGGIGSFYSLKNAINAVIDQYGAPTHEEPIHVILNGNSIEIPLSVIDFLKEHQETSLFFNNFGVTLTVGGGVDER